MALFRASASSSAHVMTILLNTKKVKRTIDKFYMLYFIREIENKKRHFKFKIYSQIPSSTYITVTEQNKN